MNFKQPTQIDNCKDCNKQFESKLVFGQWVSRCDNCKTPFNNAAQVARKLKTISRDTFISCGHNNLNPGGYCNTCGNGRDYS